MAKYTAEEMREIADELLLVNDEYHRKASAMLLQSADMMEREDEREKNYEYAAKYDDGFVSWSHFNAADGAAYANGNTDFVGVVRRSVGEWEEIKNV